MSNAPVKPFKENMEAMQGSLTFIFWAAFIGLMLSTIPILVGASKLWMAVVLVPALIATAFIQFWLSDLKARSREIERKLENAKAKD